MATIGVMGGSFNPVHNGHIAVARRAVESGLVDRVLMVLSPQNPLKAALGGIVADSLRMDMLQIACAPYAELTPCGIELDMPRPSYTIDTLRRLSEEHPADTFRLIIGADNWECFGAWRNPKEIVDGYAPIVYPRDGWQLPADDAPVTFLPGDFLEVSSTEIRQRLIRGENVDGLLPPDVLEYIRRNGLYT